MTYGYDYEVLPSALGNNSGWCEPPHARRADIQNHLKRLGRYSGPIDGAWGSNTVRGIQHSCELAGTYWGGVDAIVGSGTVRGVGDFAAAQAIAQGVNNSYTASVGQFALLGASQFYWDWFAIRLSQQ